MGAQPPVLGSLINNPCIWWLSVIFLCAGCGRETALQKSLDQSLEVANADPFSPPAPLPPAAEVSDVPRSSDGPVAPPLPDVPSPASVQPQTLTDVSETPVKIFLDEHTVPAGGKLGGEIRGRIPNASAVRLVWLDEWNRAVAHTEWTPPVPVKGEKAVTGPGRFTLDLTAGLSPKGHKQRLVLIASEAKKSGTAEWKIWAENAFEIAAEPAPDLKATASLEPAAQLADPQSVLRLANHPYRTCDELAIFEPGALSKSTFTPWYAILKDIGYRPCVLKRSNAWKPERSVKVLVLPGLSELSQEEIEAIRGLADNGVVILTDTGAPGLEREFGIVRDAETNQAAGRAILLQRNSSKPLGLESDDLRADALNLHIEQPRVTGKASLPPARAMGKAEGGAPVVLVHVFGNQRWIYLNLHTANYLEDRAKPDPSFHFPGVDPADYAKRYGSPAGGEALRVLLSEMLEEAAGKPELQVKNAAGDPVRGVWRECVNELGARRFLLSTAIRTPDAKPDVVPVRLTYPLSLYWYDPQTAQLLGHATEMATELTAGVSKVVSAMPYSVTGIKGKIRRLDSGGLLRVQLSVTREDHGPEPPPWVGHELELSLRGPGGYELPQYLETVRTINGTWDGQFKLALNDPVGDYRIMVKELYTGAKQEFVITKYECWYADLFPVKFAPLKDK